MFIKILNDSSIASMIIIKTTYTTESSTAVILLEKNCFIFGKICILLKSSVFDALLTFVEPFQCDVCMHVCMYVHRHTCALTHTYTCIHTYMNLLFSQ
jgi:hypothetical protein